MKKNIPVEFVFLPDWWYTHYGISFREPFYLDLEARIEYDIQMRKTLWDRFGLEEQQPKPRPVIGSMYVAGGFVLPALFDVHIRFQDNEPPWPECANLSREAILALRVPDLQSTWPMNLIISDMERLQSKFGYVIGDFDTDGLLNTALHLRGQQLFTDFYEDPELVQHLFQVLTETYIQVATLMRTRTGSCSIATNRSVLRVDRSLYIHSNCSVSMISSSMYRKILFPYEKRLASALQPYGVHHCGNNTERYVDDYSRLPISFLDVGWGSDIAACRSKLPGVFLNLRISPTFLRECSVEKAREIAAGLIEQAKGPGSCGLCCINMDASTPDENVMALIAVAEELRDAI